MNTLATIAQYVAGLAGLMTPAVALSEGVAQVWGAIKPLLAPHVLPPDPTPQQLADLDAQIHTLALEAHAAWHRGDAPIDVGSSQP